MRGLGKLACFVLLGSVSLAAAAQQVGGAHLDCTVLDEQSAPRQSDAQSGKEWLRRSLWAEHCRIFQARAIHIGVDGVRTLAMSHEVHDGIERKELHFLDGSPVTFEHHGASASVVHGVDGLVPASPDAVIQHLDGRYRLRLAGEERVAGRTAVRLDIEPLDEFRYGRRLWLDTATALPLKQELLDGRSRVLETFQLVELGEARIHQGRVALTPGPMPAVEGWQPGWLPPGFESQPVMESSTSSEIAHRVYGDGLATLSLFIEPLHGQPSLKPGLHRLGVSQAVVLQRHVDDQPYQVMAMGELPPEVLQRVAQGVEWSGEATSVSNRASDNG